ALVRGADCVEVVQLLEQVGEAARLQEDVKLGRVRGLVELDEPSLEAIERDLVIASEPVQVLGLLLVLRDELSEPSSMRRQVALERSELRAERSDLALERVDLRRSAGDVGGEHAFPVL